MTDTPPHSAAAAVICVAPSGARRTSVDHPALPITTAQIAREAAACAEAGASVIHLHVRDEAGRHSLDAQRYRAAIEAIRQAVGERLLVQVTTEAVGMYSPPEQISLIHASHPSTRILLVGLRTGADDPNNFDRYRSSIAMDNIKKALAGANAELRKIALADPQRIGFLDVEAWFVQRWGERGPNGDPTYKTVTIAPNLRVTNTAGDEPNNAVLNDGHAGVAANAMRAQALVAQLREDFGLTLTPVSDEDVTHFLAP